MLEQVSQSLRSLKRKGEVSSSVIIGSGLIQAALKIQEEDNGCAKESTGLVQPHHTDSLSETQITSQDSWFSIRPSIYIFFLSRGQDIGFRKRLDLARARWRLCQIWWRNGLYSIALLTTFPVMGELYFFCYTSLILFLSLNTWQSADNRLFWKVSLHWYKLSSEIDKAGSWNNKSLRDLQGTASFLLYWNKIHKFLPITLSL